MSTPEHGKAGRVLAGRYRLSEKLGQGGMGSVWRAEHLNLKSPVAVKLMDPKIMGDEGAIARFMREAQASAALRSVNVVQILDYGVDEGVPFMVLELLAGESLDQRLDREGVLSHEELALVFRDVGRAIARAHELGIVHRDLKPANIFLVREGDHELAKVLDFGIAKTGSALGHTASLGTQTGALLGTPFYMSPEQAEGDRNVDARSDLWSLGVIGYECVTGERPFFGDSLGKVLLEICSRPIPVPSQRFDVPEGFDEWFLRAVERDPERRFQTAKDLVEALGEVIGIPLGNSGSATPAGRRSRPLLAPPGINTREELGQATTVGQFGLSESTEVVPGKAARLRFGASLLILGLVVLAILIWYPRNDPSASEVAPPTAVGLQPAPRSIVAEPQSPPVLAVPEAELSASVKAPEPSVVAVPTSSSLPAKRAKQRTRLPKSRAKTPKAASAATPSARAPSKPKPVDLGI